MTAPDLIGLFIEPLERTGIRYMITGGVAAVIYGDPRFTRDIDLVLELQGRDIPALTAVFQGGEFYVPPVEALGEEAARPQGGHFNVIHRDTALRADIYLVGDDALHRWAFERRQRIPFGSIQIWVAPMEYVILRKLQYYRDSGSDRHLRDIAMMLRISGDMLDRDALATWLSRLDLAGVFLVAERYTPA
ncbi:MAG TPA: nucleotidyl transferase AbiEii/AbiGii toxin family protein [Longimicrobiales bacterium]|nr:nucleotidyl transferase AbiEii/AbiGii toxin family protein [Longimicrobiales bacterium]